MLCLTTAAGSAQTNSDQATATLQSGDKVSVFYGKDALKYACEAARDSGDVITLSAGLFNATTIQKSLHIIGNGFVKDEANGKYPTIIKGNWEFKPAEGEEQVKTSYDGTIIESLLHYDDDYYGIGGIKLRGKKPLNSFSFIKCKLERAFSPEVSTRNLTLRQCVVTSSIDLRYNSYNDNFYIVGSYVTDMGNQNANDIITIDHSILRNSLDHGKATNSILGRAASGIMAEKCIIMEGSPDKVIGAGNWFAPQYSDIFKNDVTDLKWSDDDGHFAIKDPAEYAGTDGTEVGIYGGPYPYNPTPATPQITNIDIDTTNGAEGIIRVDATVEAQTED